MKKKKELTIRQKEVLILAADGKSNDTIAGKLFITKYTVKAHLTEIYKKLNVKNRTEATRKAIDKGIIPPRDSEQP